MPLDPSIILGVGQGVTPLQNPMDVAGKALNYQNLAMQNTQNRQTFNDEQAMRNAYAQNTRVDENGNPSIDRQGILKSLAESSPSMVPKVQMDFQNMDTNTQKQKLEKSVKDLEFGSRTMLGVHDQASYDEALKIGQAAGHDTSHYPPVYDPKFVETQIGKGMEAKDWAKTQIEKLAEQNKEREFNRGVSKDKAAQLQETMQSLQSARGNPAVQQAERDLYSSAKVNKLVEQGRDKKGNLDPNALNNTQVQLLAGEVAKIATGGAPTLDELHGLTPSNMPQWLAKAAEKYQNNPTGANAGAFVKQLQAYSNGVAQDARSLLKENYQGVIESKKKYLDAGDYKTLNEQYLGRLNGTTPQSEWSLSGNGQASPSEKPAATNNKYVPSKDEAIAELQRRQKNKTAAR